MTPAASFRAILSRIAVVLAASLQLAACAAVMPRNAPPELAAVSAEPLGFRDVRYWGDEPAPRFAEASIQRASAEIPVARPLNFLAISGGAENGAFGAGLLVGWGEAG